MGRPTGWSTAQTGRAPMRSPGALPHRREVQRAFWRLIALGVTTEASAITVGVAPRVGCDWFRQAGGMQPFSLGEFSGRYLAFSEREEIAILHAQKVGVRQIARLIGRDPSGGVARVASQVRRREVARSRIGLQLPSGKPSWPRAGRRPASSPQMTGCVIMCRTG